ncbi:hypothetical protein [Streptomyces sp. IBSBF 3136]|uniref:hypothetical protein n=1 Tax=Streptomyces sp. IBSBF 3136 TaxID=2903524 RepID=UPI002FDBA4B9
MGDHYVCTPYYIRLRPYYKGVAPQSPAAQPLSAGGGEAVVKPDLSLVQVTAGR